MFPVRNSIMKERNEMYASNDDNETEALSPEFSADFILSSYSSYVWAKNIANYGYPTITAVGSFGNILSFLVMRRRSMNNSTCYYMARLALADTIILYFGCLRKWFANRNGYDSLFRSPVDCKIFYFISYFAFDLAAWILVSMTIERFIAIYFPFKAAKLATVSKAKKITLFLIVAFILINMHILWTITTDDTGYCVPLEVYEDFIEIYWPWIDAALYSFIPVFSLLIFNGFIIYENNKTHKRQNLLHAGRHNSDRRRMALRSSRRITIMLLIVSFAFLLMSAPVVILLIIKPYFFDYLKPGQDIDFPLMAKYSLARTICNIFLYSNHAINFYLYCLSGGKFRREFMRMLRLDNTCKCSRIPTSQNSMMINQGINIQEPLKTPASQNQLISQENQVHHM